LQDNAPAHKAARVWQYYFKPKNVATSYQTPYSPDLSPPEYFLFIMFKMDLKELHFADVAEIQGAVTDEFRKFQNEEFSAGFQRK